MSDSNSNSNLEPNHNLSQDKSYITWGDLLRKLKMCDSNSNSNLEPNHNLSQDKFYITWGDFQRAVDRMTGIYSNRGFDYVVGLARGGLPLGVSLSHSLNIPLIVEKLQLRDGQDDKSYSLSSSLVEAVKEGKRLLIVDDICDTGDTLKLLTDGLKEYTTEDHYNVCTLVKRHIASYAPDYWHIYIKDSKWVVFPWEK